MALAWFYDSQVNLTSWSGSTKSSKLLQSLIQSMMDTAYSQCVCHNSGNLVWIGCPSMMLYPAFEQNICPCTNNTKLLHEILIILSDHQTTGEPKSHKNCSTLCLLHCFAILGFGFGMVSWLPGQFNLMEWFYNIFKTVPIIHPVGDESGLHRKCVCHNSGNLVCIRGPMMMFTQCLNKISKSVHQWQVAAWYLNSFWLSNYKKTKVT